MSIRLYVGNLSADCDRQALEQIFHQSWEHLSLKLVMDRKTGKCRGFGFVTVETDELADAVIEKFNGLEFEGAVIKMEKALPRSKGKSEEEGGEARPRVPRPVKRNANLPVGTRVDVPATAESPSQEGATATKVAIEGSESGVEPPAIRNKKPRNGRGSKEVFKESYRESDSQPDPRWASELEQLKQRLLAAQS